MWILCPHCHHEFLAYPLTPEKELERQGQLQLEAHPEIGDDPDVEDPESPPDHLSRR